MQCFTKRWSVLDEKMAAVQWHYALGLQNHASLHKEYKKNIPFSPLINQ